jgi:hypothetical protein
MNSSNHEESTRNEEKGVRPGTDTERSRCSIALAWCEQTQRERSVLVNWYFIASSGPCDFLAAKTAPRPLVVLYLLLSFAL